MEKRVIFQGRGLPYLLLLPQVLITLIFFIWPAGRALLQSVLREDAFGLSSEFVWFDNFIYLLTDPAYLESMRVTLVFSAAVALLALTLALYLAVQADRVLRGALAYRTLLIWPYAVAPALAGVLWLFLFNPSIGILAYLLHAMGYPWNHSLNGGEALGLVTVAAAWKQISYNFLFYLAGLQAIPRSLIEASALDGAGPARRFWSIIFPLLTPITFFLLVINLVYAFFDTFGIVHQVTEGGPAGATNILVYKVFHDGFLGLDLGGSAAQSVVLMVIVVVLTVIQFRYLEHRVHY